MFKRIAPGQYCSLDGRILITRVISRQTYRPNETLWAISIDGKELPRAEDTLSDAKEEVQRLLEREK